MFATLLIANRGEIACRVIRTARAMGLRTVAVYSDADARSLHVRMADQAHPIGPGPAGDSYLAIDRILAACRLSGAAAVHPGYGFLAENAAFARACHDAGIVFVGPDPAAIEALGDKSAAKRLAEQVGVPCLPGYAGTAQATEKLVAEARRIGAPLMIKACAGGGGRGMRGCDDTDDTATLQALFESARAEALASFGSGDLLIERLAEGARHVEIQVFGDRHGNYVHLGERDCSTQRRNQKILEEAPAPGMSPALRERMGDAAIRLVRAAGYVGAGTVEFLLAPDDTFSFLEVNTRLQVEHPVTEAVTGLDLVEWQLRVAAGEPLPCRQDRIALRGHAIEARLYAEDPYRGYLPQVGRIDDWRFPSAHGLRIDHGLIDQPDVPPHYDAMIAKFVAHGDDRDEARRRLSAGLERASVLGLGTNRDFLLACLGAEPFVSSRVHTQWLSSAAAEWQTPTAQPRWLGAAAAILLHRRNRVHGPLAFWTSSGRRSSRMTLRVDGRDHRLTVDYSADRQLTISIDGETLAVRVLDETNFDVDLLVDGIRCSARVTFPFTGAATGVAVRGWLDAFGHSAAVEDLTDAPTGERAAGEDGTIFAPMHGSLVRMAVVAGDRVRRGDFLLAIEAMKMEHRIDAPIDGTIVEIGASEGTQVAPGHLLVRIAP